VTRPSARALVWNDREGRLRTPWRLALALAVVVLAGLAGALAGNAVAAAGRAGGPVVAAVAATVGQVLLLAALAAGLLAAAVALDRRRLRDLGLERSRAWWADLGFGLALGSVLPGVVFALEVAAGYATVTGTVVTRAGATLPPAAGVPFAVAFALTALYFVAVAGFEELLFRGYLLGTLAEGLRWRDSLGVRGALAGATVLTSAAFGLGHATNPSATGRGVVIIGLYGVFLAAGYLATGRLAVPLGVHATWNLSASSVFGFPVSGVSTPVTLVAVEQTGPALVTGGRFGPEAGLVSLVALAAGFGALAAWVRRREGAVALVTGTRPDLRAGDDGR